MDEKFFHISYFINKALEEIEFSNKQQFAVDEEISTREPGEDSREDWND